VAKDASGPLAIEPGDRVVYYRQTFDVRGVVLLEEGVERRGQYRLSDAEGNPLVLAAQVDRGEVLLTLERPVPRESVRYDGGEGLILGERAFALTRRGTALAHRIGDAPDAPSISYQKFQDEDGGRVVVFERWGGTTEVRTGEVLDEGEISIEHGGRKRFVPRAPTRLDAREVNLARSRTRAGALDLTEEEKAQALAEARAKLAALAEEESAPGEDQSIP
jgi:hypothetical protein